MSMEKATAKLALVEQDLDKARARVRDLEQQAERLRTYIEVATELNSSPQLKAPVRPAKITKGEKLVGYCIEIITAREGPVRTRELVAELTKRGIDIGGTNPVTNLSGALSKSPHLINDRVNGWSLAEWEETVAIEDRYPDLDEPDHQNEDDDLYETDKRFSNFTN